MANMANMAMVNIEPLTLAQQPAVQRDTSPGGRAEIDR